VVSLDIIKVSNEDIQKENAVGQVLGEMAKTIFGKHQVVSDDRELMRKIKQDVLLLLCFPVVFFCIFLLLILNRGLHDQK
jgi:hypothetical protein